MRTAIEIPDEQHARLRELAARRGDQDFSKLVQEAIDLYLNRDLQREARVKEALSVVGTLDEVTAERMEDSLRRLRESWR